MRQRCNPSPVYWGRFIGDTSHLLSFPFFGLPRDLNLNILSSFRSIFFIKLSLPMGRPLLVDSLCVYIFFFNTCLHQFSHARTGRGDRRGGDDIRRRGPRASSIIGSTALPKVTTRAACRAWQSVGLSNVGNVDCRLGIVEHLSLGEGIPPCRVRERIHAPAVNQLRIPRRRICQRCKWARNSRSS